MRAVSPNKVNLAASSGAHCCLGKPRREPGTSFVLSIDFAPGSFECAPRPPQSAEVVQFQIVVDVVDVFCRYIDNSILEKPWKICCLTSSFTYRKCFNSCSFTKDTFHGLCKTRRNYILDLFIAEQCKFYYHNIYSQGLDNVFCTY